MLSLRKTARLHGVSPGGLSKAVHAGRAINGMALHGFAVLEEGKIAGFDFPSWYEFPTEESGGETTFMTIPELCDEFPSLNRGKVEHAVREDWKIGGHDLSSWAVFDAQGRLEGLEVPSSANFDGPAHFDRFETSGEAQPRPDDALKDQEAEGGSRVNGALALGGALGLSVLLNS